MEVFVMSNKLQAKDLINLGLFTVLYFVVFDYRHPVHAVPDQS